MDSSSQSPGADKADAKGAFRKPAGDASARKYRHRSPAGESPSHGSPKNGHAANPKLSGEERGKVYEDQYRRSDNRRDVDRHSDRSHHGRGSDSYRNSERHHSRSSHGYSRHDDFNRHEKHSDEERYHQRFSSNSDHSRSSRDHLRALDKSRDKYNGVVYKSKDKESEASFPEHQRYKDRDSSFDKAGSGRRHVNPEDVESDRLTREKDGIDGRRDRDFDGQRHPTKEQKKKFDDMETNGSKDQYTREGADKSGEKYVLGSESQEAAFKQQKFSLEMDVGSRKRVSKFTSVAEADVTVAANDINAAKSAAMKAAELVNKNLDGGVGTGLMTADQKKKLLWGNKKATAAVEVGHRWDNAMSYDRERQDKFNKLMSLSLPWCLWQIVGREGRSESGSHSREQVWQQSPPRREAERAPARLGEAIHCWAAQERWPHCWTRFISACPITICGPCLNFLLHSLCINNSLHVFDFPTRIMSLVISYLWFLVKYEIYHCAMLTFENCAKFIVMLLACASTLPMFTLMMPNTYLPIWRFWTHN